MSLPVRTALVTPVRRAMAVVAEQIWSALTTTPVPPSTRTPVWALSVAALFSMTIPLLGVAEPPEAEAPVTSGWPST